MYASAEATEAVQLSVMTDEILWRGDYIGKAPYHERVSGDLGQILIIVAVWTVGSVVLATVWFWLRPRIPGHRLVVVALRADDPSGRRRRIVAVAGQGRTLGPDRVVAEIDPTRHVISLPRRRVHTAAIHSPVAVSGLLRYEILDPAKAQQDSEPIAVVLGEAIVAAVDESLRDMPLPVALRSHEEVGRRLADALVPLRAHGIHVTAVELLPFLGPDGQAWGATPVRSL